MGMPAEVEWKVEELDAPSKLVMRGAGPMGAQLATTITRRAAAATARQVSYEAEFSGGAIQGPMGDVVTQNAGSEIDTSLAKLKELRVSATAEAQWNLDGARAVHRAERVRGHRGAHDRLREGDQRRAPQAPLR